MPQRRYQQRRTSSNYRKSASQSGARYTKKEVQRNRVVLLVAVVVILVLVGVMGFKALAPSPEPTQVESQPQQQDNAAQSDLAWRDSDFAVDPNRTDWNYSDNGRKVVYLTIDDGPSEKTQAVLDILDRYGCKATFFVVGHNPDYFPMIKEAYDRGHSYITVSTSCCLSARHSYE